MSTSKLIDRLEQILPGIQNSNSQAEVAMVEVLPEVIAELARLKAERDAMAEALRPFAGFSQVGEPFNKGDNAPVYGRNETVLLVGHFRAAAALESSK